MELITTLIFTIFVTVIVINVLLKIQIIAYS
jgi:hypothetical protein